MSKINEIKRGGGAKWGGLLQGTTGVGSIFKIANNAVIGTVGVHTIIENTQASSHVAQKIDLGTSAQGHTGILINMTNNSSLARGVTINTSGSPGYGIDFPNSGGNGSRGISFSGTISNNASSAFGIYQFRIFTSNGGNQSGYGIYQDTIISTGFQFTNQNGYGIYQNWINSGRATGYGIYQNKITHSTSDGIGYGIYQNVIGGSSNTNGSGNGVGWYVNQLAEQPGFVLPKFFSLNGSISGSLANRTIAMSENLVSRTSTRTSGTTDDTHDQTHFRRTSVQNGAGGIFNAGGSVLKLENIATQTAGTLNDTVTPLSLLNQSGVSNGGHMRFNAYTPQSEANVPNNTMWWTGTVLKIKDNAGVVKTATLT